LFPFTLLPSAILILQVRVQVPAFFTAVRIRLVVLAARLAILTSAESPFGLSF
jgi:hypothetical protein